MYDSAKDAANRAKHGISLARAGDLEILGFVDDRTRYAEPRYRLYGLIDGLLHYAAAVDRGHKVRIISLRRAHAKELKRHGH